MKISIVIPSKNAGRHLRACVESVLSQLGTFETELIVRDGLSSDNSPAILAEFAGRCEVVSQPDSCPQEAINAGMSQASGEIGAWLGADDLYEPGALAEVAKAFEANPSLQWLYGSCRIIDDNDNEIRRPITLYKELLGRFNSRSVLLCENFISQPAVFWRMDFWRSLGGLNGKMKAAWDYELWLKMSDKAKPLRLGRRLASFRRHSGSISHSSYETQFAEELAAARSRSNALQNAIHRFNCWKTVTAYKLLDKLSRPQGGL